MPSNLKEEEEAEGGGDVTEIQYLEKAFLNVLEWLRPRGKVRVLKKLTLCAVLPGKFGETVSSEAKSEVASFANS